MNPTQTPNLFHQRQARLATALQLANLNALALNPGPSLTYLTGLNFHLMERPVVALFQPHQPLILILPNLERAKLEDFPLPVQAYPFGENPVSWDSIFRQAAAALENPAVIGVEPTRLRFLELHLLQNALPNAEFISAAPMLADLRMSKDAAELAAMRTATEIAEAALLATLPAIRPGISERALASELTLQLLKHGSDPELPFNPIVAAGPNSANPHAAPTDRLLQTGDLLIIDWGASHRGYFSDLTRTFAIGTVTAELAHIAEVVQRANRAAFATAQAGIAAGAVDRAARAVIEQANYGEFFTHRTGHGLGLEAHEPPYLFGENESPLVPGTTFTIEPGIYLPGRGGVRIEDDVVITTAGCESLSNLPRELKVLP
ncbi:MAG: aminopeptidase P family protein [Anaerolineales bacterium]